MVTTGSWTGSRIRTAAAASLIALLLGGCGGSSDTSGDSSGGSYGSTSTTSSLGCSDVAGASATVLARINALRAVARQCGSTRFAAAGALSWSSTLASAAQAHASDMARSNYFDHTGLDGSTPASRARRAGYTSDQVGENIGAGYASAEAALQGWLASAGHCSALMNAGFQEVALACTPSSTAQYGSYWVLMLGRR
ncbi:MAG: CAP domain-containing protein [Sphaerotilus natans subsp. sulfidivorans]|uniref:CAP domain-containing protein n=1 Tax=Sphaerotilus sulfidivorans TaxID=639200 RepID=UPI002353F399|nr:CAP domain-containing protein [Sphaerotilus sulfidivorans]MCK6400410.1 CAP domain-containing protein [Sphaerotilus sulfidivorans]